MNRNNNLLEEYKLLSNEITRLYSQQEDLAKNIVPLVTSILVIIIDNGNPFLLFSPYLFMVFQSFRFIEIKRRFVRISAYMVVYLEPFLDGIGWETRNTVLTLKRNSFKDRIFRASGSYGVVETFFTCIWYSTFYYYKLNDLLEFEIKGKKFLFEYSNFFKFVFEYERFFKYAPVALFFFVLISLFLISGPANNKNSRNYIKEWNNLKNEAQSSFQP